MMSVGTDALAVADLMTIDPITIRVDDTLEAAEDLLRSYRISGLPVTDEEGRLVGVISQTDLLFLDTPPVRALVRRRESGIRVGEIMTSPPMTIDMEASIREAAQLMTEQRLHRLVAVDRSGRPIGVLSSMDFVALAAEG
jgi:CBS domain-containing protein